MAFAVVQHLASFWLALPLAIVLGPRARRVARTLSALAARRRRSSVAGAAELRPDPAHQRGPAHHLRQRSARHRRAARAQLLDSVERYVRLSGLPVVRLRHRYRVCDRRRSRDGAHAHRHDAARQRREPPDGARARRRCQAHVSRRHRGGHRLRGAGRRHRSADRLGLSRHGRSGADPVVCGDCARRHRLASRCAGRRDAARIGRCIRQAILSELRGVPGLCGDDRGADRRGRKACFGAPAHEPGSRRRKFADPAGRGWRCWCRSSGRATRSSLPPPSRSRRVSRSRSGSWSVRPV